MKFILNKNYVLETRTIPLVSFLVALSILIGLCVWQLKRLAWKEELINLRVERFEKNIVPFESLEKPENHEFTKVKIKGTFYNQFEMYMPALSKNGNNGYHILVPLKLIDNTYIIYDLGWIPLRKKSKEKRLENIVNDFHEMEAVLRTPGRKGKYQPDNELENNFWFFVEPIQMSKFTGLNLEKLFYLEAVNNGPAGFPLGGQTRIYIRNNHLQYAITWFLIALGLIGVFMAASLKKIK